MKSIRFATCLNLKSSSYSNKSAAHQPSFSIQTTNLSSFPLPRPHYQPRKTELMCRSVCTCGEGKCWMGGYGAEEGAVMGVTEGGGGAVSLCRSA